MKKSQICKTRRDGQACELLVEQFGEPACTRITCCNDPDLPSPTMYQVQLHSPFSRCRHPNGDFWAGAESDAEPCIEPAAIYLPRHLATIQARGRKCKGGCEHHFYGDASPWGCSLIGSSDIRKEIKNAAFVFPDGCPIAACKE